MRVSSSPAEGPPSFSNEPLVDFSRSIERERMREALARVRRKLGRDYELCIGGADVTSGQWIESENPADFREIVGRAARARVEDADRAVEAATEAQKKWANASAWRRADALFQAARLLRARRFEMSAWMVLECGKQWREADADVAEAVDFCEYYARAMLSMDAPRLRNQPGEDNAYFYVPRGVVAVVAPWNFPLAILCGMTMAPLVAGNAVVMKPAEQSSVVAAKFFEILSELDLPAGAVNFLPGVGEEVGARLVEHPGVAVVNFTGSAAVGLWMRKKAAEQPPGQRQLKHVVAEMGGKNAVIVDEDADLDEAVKGVVVSAFGYQGQKCSACSRAIVLPRVYHTFVGRLRDAIASLAIGPPEDPAFAMGPVIDREAKERLEKQIEQAKAEATCLHAGDVGELSTKGWYVGPHLFTDVDPKSMLGQTELFGPVLAVMRAANIDEALAVANGTAYALTGGIFSRNPLVIDRARREFAVGNLYINRKITGAEVDRQPFGGFRLSGVGAKAGGPDYLHHFVHARTVTENTLRRGFAPEQDGP